MTSNFQKNLLQKSGIILSVHKFEIGEMKNIRTKLRTLSFFCFSKSVKNPFFNKLKNYVIRNNGDGNGWSNEKRTGLMDYQCDTMVDSTRKKKK